MPNPPPPEWTERIRFDTLAATPVRLSGTLGDRPVDTDGCRLDEPFPADPDSTRAISCPGNLDGATTQGGYAQPLPLGGVGTIKSLRRWFVTTEATTTFAAGIGVLSRYTSYEIDIDERHTLAYARVAGVEYGTPIVATEPAPAGADGMNVAPNPTNGRVTVSFHVETAGPVRVTVHDLLGRELLVAHEGRLPAGAHSLPLDTTGLPAGVYAIRAAADGRTRAAAVVVR
jgi:hypothetical protein